MPFSISFTRFCAARPIATPAMPAEASSGPRSTPSASRNCRPTIAPMIASPVVRITWTSVFTCAARPRVAACASATLIVRDEMSRSNQLRIMAMIATPIRCGSFSRTNSWMSTIHSSVTLSMNWCGVIKLARAANQNGGMQRSPLSIYTVRMSGAVGPQDAVRKTQGSVRQRKSRISTV